MELLPIIIFACYFILVGFLIIGWTRATMVKSAAPGVSNEFVSVIIPTRNEESNIKPLLSDLEKQNYAHFEVIVIDDHSEDETVSVVRTFVEKDNTFRILHNRGAGKKTALTLGVQSAKGSIIVTTDADCRVSSEWISILVERFKDQKIKMAIGCVKMQANSFFSSVQSLEFASLIGSGVAMASWNLPVLCNGANLAFRKSVFVEVRGYEDNLHIPSGDDEFLMRKVLTAHPTGIEVVVDKKSVVTTLPNSTVRELVQQRIRWAGKWTANHSATNMILALFIFTVQLTTLLLPLFVIINWMGLNTLLLLVLTKTSVELIFLRRVTQFLQSTWSWAGFALLQVIYPAYVVATAIFSRFNSFEWKGRKINALTVSNKLNKEIPG